MIIIIIIFVIFIGITIGNWYLNENAPEEKIEGTLKEKKKVSSINADNVVHDNYYLIFEIKRETKKFKVNHSIYKKYHKDATGILVFKRKRFIDFIIQ